MIPSLGAREPAWARSLDPDDIAPWVFADVPAWPRSVEDRLVAIRIGVQLQHVQLAREVAPVSSVGGALRTTDVNGTRDG